MKTKEHSPICKYQSHWMGFVQVRLRKCSCLGFLLSTLGYHSIVTHKFCYHGHPAYLLVAPLSIGDSWRTEHTCALRNYLTGKLFVFHYSWGRIKLAPSLWRISIVEAHYCGPCWSPRATSTTTTASPCMALASPTVKHSHRRMHTRTQIVFVRRTNCSCRRFGISDRCGVVCQFAWSFWFLSMSLMVDSHRYSGILGTASGKHQWAWSSLPK